MRWTYCNVGEISRALPSKRTEPLEWIRPREIDDLSITTKKGLHVHVDTYDAIARICLVVLSTQKTRYVQYSASQRHSGAEKEQTLQ